MCYALVMKILKYQVHIFIYIITFLMYARMRERERQRAEEGELVISKKTEHM